ncbi:hypothetical protein OEZ85_007666 [Tetradesmus obliquus]|uniref:DNA helicase n=1 Tax=Tetradesmus obliquus TaxID=3088 RepID=A0ABY8TGX8_TETOB|nr:hypothetical protein OEZ85_007666 [Tetradesmus obliquus]
MPCTTLGPPVAADGMPSAAPVPRPAMQVNQNVLLPIVQLQLSATGQITPVYAAAAASNLLFLSPVDVGGLSAEFIERCFMDLQQWEGFENGLAMQTLYQLNAGLPLMLGVIKCGVRIALRMNGFLVAAPTSQLPLVDGPVISYDRTSGYTVAQTAALVDKALQQQKDLGNPVIRQYLTVLERAAAEHEQQQQQQHQQQQGSGTQPAASQGYFDGGITFSEYVKMRSMQLFSRFTLVREYLLVMIQVYMVHHMLSAVKESTLKDEVQRIKDNNPSMPIKRRIRFASAAVLSKAITPSESACIAAGIPIIQTSYKVTYVDVTPPAKRRAYLGRGGKMAASHVTLYMSRPESCMDLLFEDYFAQHIVVGHDSNVQRPQGATTDHAVMDQLTNSVYKCEKRRLVRLPDFHPVYQSEALFYKHLLCSKPWRSEEDMRPRDGSWFNECVRQGVVSSLADVDRAIDGYASFHMHDTAVIEQLRELFKQKQDLSFLWGTVSAPSSHDADVQQEHIDAFYTLKDMMSWTGNAHVSMLVGATTAAAAQRLNRPGQADTIDALLGLWVGGEFGMLPVDSQLRAALEAARVCIFDEFSMLTYDKLMYMKHRMRMATRAGQPIKLLILSGDEQQLPPVCKHKFNSKLGHCKKCHVCTTPDWQEAQHFELEEVYRQASDQPFLHFLNNSRKHTPTASNIDYILGAFRAVEVENSFFLGSDPATPKQHATLIRLTIIEQSQ